MGTRAVDGGARRWKAVQVGGGFAVLAGVLFALPNLHRPPPPSTALHRADIHSEYVKFPSGRDTITAYLAYPERKDPAPAVVVIHEIDRKSTRLNSSHLVISYAVFCLKKKTARTRARSG